MAEWVLHDLFETSVFRALPSPSECKRKALACLSTLSPCLPDYHNGWYKHRRQVSRHAKSFCRKEIGVEKTQACLNQANINLGVGHWEMCTAPLLSPANF